MITFKEQRTCPKCREEHKKAAERAQQKAEEAYGKYSAAEYHRLLEDAKHIASMVVSGTGLHEFIEVGIDVDGMFSMKYKAGCQDCGWQSAYYLEPRPAHTGA